MAMDLENSGINLWLLRGIPKWYEESDVIETLRQPGVTQPDFWYMPGIRKSNLLNRGYAFVGYRCTRDSEARHLMTCIATNCFPWPLQMERSTSSTEHMENTAKSWAAPFATQRELDRGVTQSQASQPRLEFGERESQPAPFVTQRNLDRGVTQPNSLEFGKREACLHKRDFPLHAPPHPTDIRQLLIQEQRSGAASRGQALVSESDTLQCHNLGYDRVYVLGDKKFPVIPGLPTFL